MTPAVRLEPFEQADIPRLIGWIPSPEALTLWAGPTEFTWPLTEEQLDRYLEPAMGPDPSRLVFRAVESATGDVVGHVELTAFDRARDSARLARVLVDPLRRSEGLGTCMVDAALDLAFGTLRMGEIDLRVAQTNEPARRCYRSLGFERDTASGPATQSGGGTHVMRLPAGRRQRYNP